MAIATSGPDATDRPPPGAATLQNTECPRCGIALQRVVGADDPGWHTKRQDWSGAGYVPVGVPVVWHPGGSRRVGTGPDLALWSGIWL